MPVKANDTVTGRNPTFPWVYKSTSTISAPQSKLHFTEPNVVRGYIVLYLISLLQGTLVVHKTPSSLLANTKGHYGDMATQLKNTHVDRLRPLPHVYEYISKQIFSPSFEKKSVHSTFVLQNISIYMIMQKQLQMINQACQTSRW